MFDTFLKSVVKIEKIPLPGELSQLKMSPPFRKKLIEIQKDKIINAKQSAVMALFYPDEANMTRFVLILRKTYKGVHSAQVGFPGGKLEPNETNKEAALRETFEEVGVNPSKIKVLKALTELYIPPSNFFVHPFLGICNEQPIFVKQESEVEAVLEVSLDSLLKEENGVTKSVSTPFEVNVEVPAYLLNSHLVWGATAMILSEVKDLLKAAF
jgi:8-oxo-dGTP pyrophosphatase MutT (NUDIX family)